MFYLTEEVTVSQYRVGNNQLSTQNCDHSTAVFERACPAQCDGGLLAVFEHVVSLVESRVVSPPAVR